MEGYIKLHRRIAEMPTYFTEPFCKNMAWIDLLILANHKPGVIYKRGIKIDLDRGDVGYSYRELAKRWKWSVNKAARFIDLLRKNGKIGLKMNTGIGTQNGTQKNNVTACISILNYNKYQGDGTQNETLNGTQTNTQTEHKRIQNNNDNNDKKKEVVATPYFYDEESATKLMRYIKYSYPTIFAHPITLTPSESDCLLKKYKGSDKAVLQEKLDLFKDNEELIRTRPSVYDLLSNVPSITEVEKYFEQNGYSTEAAKKAHRHYHSLNWKNAQGKIVANWKNTVGNNWFKDEYKIPDFIEPRPDEIGMTQLQIRKKRTDESYQAHIG